MLSTPRPPGLHVPRCALVKMQSKRITKSILMEQVTSNPATNQSSSVKGSTSHSTPSSDSFRWACVQATLSREMPQQGKHNYGRSE